MSIDVEDINYEGNFGPPASNLRRINPRTVYSESDMASMSDKSQSQETKEFRTSARKSKRNKSGKIEVGIPSMKEWLQDKKRLNH